jgi:hypothetical protein
MRHFNSRQEVKQMKMKVKKIISNDNGRERGAALLSVLLLATLLLGAGGALVLTTTLSASNAIDSSAEMQAYYGAEAGLQATINILRGNVYNDSSTPVASYRSVVEPSLSNTASDPATAQNIARLSKWLTYNSNNRIVMPGTNNLIAYDVTARDLDDSKNVRYSTSGAFDALSSGCTASGATLTCGSAPSTITLTYTPQSAATVLAYPATTSGLGSFSLTHTGSGASIASGSPARFRLTLNQTLPWAAKETITADVSGSVVGANSTLTVSFHGSTLKASGTQFDLCAACNPLSLNYSVLAAATTTLNGTLTAPQPQRILVRATGYGPKGATKKLEMELGRNIFDFDAPATLTMRGSDDCTPLTFDSGSSGAKDYTGVDHAGAEAQLPTFAVSGCDVSAANSGISKHDTVADPELAYLDNSSLPAGSAVTTLQTQTPDFLQSADKARAYLNNLQAAAVSQGRYFTPSTAGGSYTVSDSNTSPDEITFVDGDCDLSGGSGLLVVTGNLQMSGNPSFNGVVLVLGGGYVNRNGGGDGNFYGAMVVAGFDRNGTGGFTAPYFNTNGGGNSTLQYDSVAVARAMGAVGTVVGGVREY